MYGSCSPGVGTSPTNMLSVEEILHRDRLRVKSLQARFKYNSMTNKYDSHFQDTKEVTHLPVLFSTGNYAINISLGTPQQRRTLIFDTGSDLTWTRGFHDYNSISFYSISCKSDKCTSLLPHHTCENFDYTENKCHFDVEYEDDTQVKGVFSMEILNITQTGDVFPNFLFGHALKTTEGFKGDGILSLSRAPVSFVNQTKEIYKGIFSYCFPSNPSSTGFLKLGPRDYLNNMKFTSLITNSNQPSFYFINITSIKVANVELLINKLDLMFPEGTIIDSGTKFTRLPEDVYRKMCNEFKTQMKSLGQKNLHPSPSRVFDTCYDYYSLYHSNINIPTINITFEGGVTVALDGSTTFFVFSSLKFACLAFIGDSDADSVAVFGNHQQMKYEVAYDVYGGKL